MLSARGGVKRVTVEAVVTKADGSREDLGVIADTKTGNIVTQFFKNITRRSK
jgi:hypothetical protein